jgi:hypothetical protein
MHTDLESQAGLRRLLRALPEVTQQPYAYQEFEQRVLERERMARGATGSTRLLAAAVVAVAAVSSLWRLTALTPEPLNPRSTTAGAPSAQGLSPQSDDARTMEQERWLANLPQEPALVHVGARSAVMGLQDRIAQVDDLLSIERNARAQPARLQALRQERARLVGTLVQVRYAETLADNLP